MRTIKSFVLRAGRVSNRQQQGLHEYLPKYLMAEPGQMWDLQAEFGSNADCIVEIGFGMGASLLSMAKASPQTHFIGIEVHQAGLGSLAADLFEQDIQNVRLAPYDAVKVFQESIADHSLQGVQIFFPDPWPKKRHQKRRLIQADFIALITRKLKAGGFLHCATDWEDYAIQMLEVLSEQEGLINEAGPQSYSERPQSRPLTKFELRGQRLGHGVWDLLFKKR